MIFNHFRSSVTAIGQTPLPTPALWVPGSMKRIANSSPNRRNKKDEDMGASTHSRLDHGSWQTSLPTPALWVLRSMKRTRQIHISGTRTEDANQHRLFSRGCCE